MVEGSRYSLQTLFKETKMRFSNKFVTVTLSARRAKGFLHSTFTIELVKRMMVSALRESAEKGAAIS
jgi:hypothetical protein